MSGPVANECRVIGYCRVSTQEQAASGLSLAAQRRRLDAYCHAHEFTLVRVEEDAGISARKTTNRPALQRALKALKKGEADGLVAVKLDRLSRTTRGTRYRYYRRAWNSALKRAGLAERTGLVFHSLRHSFATAYLQNGAVTDLQGLLGHSSLNTTQIYAGMVNSRARKSVEALDPGI